MTTPEMQELAAAERRAAGEKAARYAQPPGSRPLPPRRWLHRPPNAEFHTRAVIGTGPRPVWDRLKAEAASAQKRRDAPGYRAATARQAPRSGGR